MSAFVSLRSNSVTSVFRFDADHHGELLTYGTVAMVNQYQVSSVDTTVELDFA